MYPNWLHVEYAITFFKSFWTNPTEAANKDVIAPIKHTAINAVEDCSNKGEVLNNKYTPAVTIVAAWINADTGVGLFNPSLCDRFELYNR